VTSPSNSGTPGEPGLDEPGLEPRRGGTGTLLEQEVEATPRTSHGDGDHERFAHFVRKEKILESALSGDPVIALCGKVWVPGRDPQRFPVCPTCREIYGQIPGRGEGDGGDANG
jgi:hypothetical protein